MSTVRKPRPANAINCHICSQLVALATVERLQDEFTVRCPNCGHRSFYRTKEIRSLAAEPPTAGEKSALLTKAL